MWKSSCKLEGRVAFYQPESGKIGASVAEWLGELTLTHSPPSPSPSVEADLVALQYR